MFILFDYCGPAEHAWYVKPQQLYSIPTVEPCGVCPGRCAVRSLARIGEIAERE